MLPLSDTPSATNAALMPRASLTTEGGTITGNYGDLLYTYGLATCVGMAATGDPTTETATDKVLGHISCERNQADIDDWVNTVLNSGMTNLQIVVSVVDPSLVDPDLQDAQTALNGYAVTQAQSLVINDINNVIKVIRTDPLDAPTPKGTVKIQYDRQIEAEGAIVWASRNPQPPSGCENASDPDAGAAGNWCSCPDGSCWMNMPGVSGNPCSPPLDVPITCPA